jgi:carbon monoxide dehydrogenase subunit G
MRLTGTHTFAAPRQKVWEVLNDPQRLAKCMPGCENLETTGENEYSGQINVGLAAVKGVYNGKVKLEDIQPPTHYKMLLDGKGKQGFIKGAGTIDLEEQDGHTVLRYTGDVQIGGPLASVGQRMVDGAAKMMIGQFFTAMEAELAAMPGEEVRQGVAINLWRSFLRWLQGLFTGLFGKQTAASYKSAEPENRRTGESGKL